MEAAFGVAVLVVVLTLCLAGIAAMSMQVRCIDAAREAARLAARGDERSAIAAGDVSTWLKLPRRSGSDASSVVCRRTATNAS